MILQRIRIIVGDAVFEPETSAPEVWCLHISGIIKKNPGMLLKIERKNIRFRIVLKIRIRAVGPYHLSSAQIPKSLVYCFFKANLAKNN